jgi:chemotaxis protein histidine kinase CheA
MKKLLKEAIFVATLAIATIPISALAETLPTNDNPTAFEQIPIYEELTDPSTNTTTEETLFEIPVLVNTGEEIFRSISTGNYGGAISGLFGLLGELGLIDPADQAARVGSESANPRTGESQNPYSHPKTPREVYDLERYLRTVRTEFPQKLSQIAFGQKGQQVLAKQNKALEKSITTSVQAEQSASKASQKSIEQAKQSESAAKNVDAEAQNAESAKASQDVLKAIASQNKDLANIGAANSSQLAQLGQASSNISTQLNATNNQLSVLNDRTQSIEVLSASQNYQTAQINAAIEQGNEYQQRKDTNEQNTAYDSFNYVYIPGLLPKDP